MSADSVLGMVVNGTYNNLEAVKLQIAMMVAWELHSRFSQTLKP